MRFEKIGIKDIEYLKEFCDDEIIKNILRQVRDPYFTAYNIAMNNHRNRARQEDVLSEEEYRVAMTWFNRLCDVTDTLDTSVFSDVPPKILKHYKG